MSKKDYGLQPHEIKLAEAVISMKAENKTFTQIADENGISRRQLQNIRAKDNFKTYVKERSIELSSQRLPEMLLKLEAEALKGNMKAHEMYYKIHGLFSSDKVEISNLTPQKELTNEELHEQLSSLKLVVNNER